DWVEALLFAFVVAMIIRNYTFQNFKIPSESMVKTLLIGDYLVANKVKFFFTDPKRGDIVTFRYPVDPPNPRDLKDTQNPISKYADKLKPLYPPLYINEGAFIDLPAWTLFGITYYAPRNVVKRVIGLPGDEVEMRDKTVYVNDQPYSPHTESYYLPEQFRQNYNRTEEWADGSLHTFNFDNFEKIKVPEGKYFVMGDNRDYSADSRYWGFLDRESITGTPAFIFFSEGEDINRVEYRNRNPQYSRNLPVKNIKRWDRVFKLIR
ncbi:MAG: signal peptidase I, partial [Candidatus Cloacimonetes bacterium]|nr:signal peptidase I [Candidatus Cloacimonadota bacterium]